MAHHGLLIVQRHPCNACAIITALNRETFEKVGAKRKDFTYELVVIDHPKELASMPFVEVESLPIAVVDDEQITAGTILPPKRLLEILDYL